MWHSYLLPPQGPSSYLAQNRDSGSRVTCIWIYLCSSSFLLYISLRLEAAKNVVWALGDIESVCRFGFAHRFAISHLGHFHTMYKSQHTQNEDWAAEIPHTMSSRRGSASSPVSSLESEEVWTGWNMGIQQNLFITQSGALCSHLSVMIVTSFRTRTGSGLSFLPWHLVLCLAHGVVQ